jgi:SAM-dependent methyltransferase
VEDLARAEALEKAILKKRLRPAVPVGLRYDRLEEEGLLPPSGVQGPDSASGESGLESIASLYWACNSTLVTLLVGRQKRALVVGEESWATRLLPDIAEHAELFQLERVPERPGLGEARTQAVSGSLLPGTSLSLPFEDASFEAVISDSSVLLSGSLEGSILELKRVTAQGGRLVALLPNWGYEMRGKTLTYESSFRRYRGAIYLGLVKRTVSPPRETEYVCLLDFREPAVEAAAKMPREALIRLRPEDIPDLGRHILSAELIQIPQVTRDTLYNACNGAGFSSVVVSGAPGSVALLRQVRRLSSAEGSPNQADLARESLLAVAASAPFVPAHQSPHLVAVCLC